MAKLAKLVRVCLLTRVIVDEGATDEQIIEAAKAGFQVKLDNNELLDNLHYIKNDEECPVGTFENDVYFQPDFDDVDVKSLMMSGEFNSFDVFKSKEKCKNVFPNAKVIEYSGGDIENPNFVDDDWE